MYKYKYVPPFRWKGGYLCGYQSDMLGFVGRAAVGLICWALRQCGCQSDMLGFVGCVAISLICWALLAVRLSV